ncbi:tlde1 domain-containing protein [Erwinia tracheiphila]
MVRALQNDGTIDDYTFINGVRRGNFRLHPRGPMGVSEGCITFVNRSDFLQIRQALLATSPVMLRNGLRSYGTIEVVANGSKACPGRI